MRNKLINAITFLFCLGIAQINFAQNVGINPTGATPDNSAMLDIVSPDKGLLIPRMDSTSRKNIVTPAQGLMVFDSTYNSFYYHDGTTWSAIGEGDNLGDHKLSQNLQVNNHWLSNNGADNGMYIDSIGQVGIGTQPSDRFHVKIEPDTFLQTMVNQTWANGYANSGGYLPQTFTATNDDTLYQVNIGMFATTSTKTLTIYEGDGTGGAVLFTSDPFTPPYCSGQSCWYGIPIDPGVALSSGQVYTLFFSLDQGIQFDNRGDRYGGGGLHGGVLDIRFQLLTRRITANTGLVVGSNNGLTINNYTIPITDGSSGQVLATDGSGTVSWTDKTTNTDNQQLTIGANILSLTNQITPVSLVPYLDNTDNQQLTISTNTLSLTNGGSPISLSPYLDNTDNQQLNVSNDSLRLDNGGTPIPIAQIDAQELSIADDTIHLTNSNTSIDLKPYLDNTDHQQLTISNDSIFLSNDATAISLNPYLDNTDNQQLTISNDSLFLSNDATAIDMNPYLDNTDSQQLTLSGNNLSLTNGGTPINLDPYLDADNLGNHTATQNILIGVNAIQNNSSSANGLSLGPENQLLVESDFQRTGYFTTTGTTPLGEPLGNYLEVVNKAGTRAIVGADGAGLYSETDTFNMVLGNWTSLGTMSFHVNSGTKVMSLDASGRLGIGRIATTNHLEVGGDASKTTAGNWLANSDARLKKNITSLSSNDMLNKLLSLNGVTYEWNDNKTNTKRPEGIQYGFTAQNIQEIFPSLVTEDNNGFLQTPYGTYDAMTVEAIRALNDKIEKQTLKIDELNTLSRSLKEENEALKTQSARIDQLESMVEKLTSELK